jgi:hypothetical protein
LLAVVILLALAAAAALTARTARDRGAAADDAQRAEAAQRQLEDLRRLHTLIREEHDFFVCFLQELSQLTRGHGVPPPELPAHIVRVTARVFAPDSAVLLLLGDARGRPPILKVAAAEGAAGVAVGFETPADAGEIGLALRGRTVLTRGDLLCPDVRGRREPRTAAGLEFDMVAPLCFGDQALGLIGLRGPSRTSEGARAALQLIAQAAAQALKSTLALDDRGAVAANDEVEEGEIVEDSLPAARGAALAAAAKQVRL